MLTVIKTTGEDSVEQLAVWVAEGRHSLCDCLRMAHNRALSDAADQRIIEYGRIAHMLLGLKDHTPTAPPPMVG